MSNLAYNLEEVVCPECGSHEAHPTADDKILIRAYKVCTDDGHWWSHCLVCADYYDADLNETPENFQPDNGWF